MSGSKESGAAQAHCLFRARVWHDLHQPARSSGGTHKTLEETFLPRHAEQEERVESVELRSGFDQVAINTCHNAND